MSGTYRYVLERKEFHFSSAHFTIFGPGDSEELHGHNFSVKFVCTGHGLDEHGLLLDIRKPAEALRGVCSRLDSRTLLPGNSSLLQIARSAGEVEVVFDSKRWLFPEESVVELPVTNISGECLAAYIWETMEPAMAGTRAEKMAIGVEEKDGMAFWYENDVKKAVGNQPEK